MTIYVTYNNCLFFSVCFNYFVFAKINVCFLMSKIGTQFLWKTERLCSWTSKGWGKEKEQQKCEVEKCTFT